MHVHIFFFREFHFNNTLLYYKEISISSVKMFCIIDPVLTPSNADVSNIVLVSHPHLFTVPISAFTDDHFCSIIKYNHSKILLGDYFAICRSL